MALATTQGLRQGSGDGANSAVVAASDMNYVTTATFSAQTHRNKKVRAIGALEPQTIVLNQSFGQELASGIRIGGSTFVSCSCGVVGMFQT
jgi:hypothetical protein